MTWDELRAAQANGTVVKLAMPLCDDYGCGATVAWEGTRVRILSIGEPYSRKDRDGDESEVADVRIEVVAGETHDCEDCSDCPLEVCRKVGTPDEWTGCYDIPYEEHERGHYPIIGPDAFEACEEVTR